MDDFLRFYIGRSNSQSNHSFAQFLHQKEENSERKTHKDPNDSIKKEMVENIDFQVVQEIGIIYFL